MKKVLVTGALGQVGTELYTALVAKYSVDNVIKTDVRKDDSEDGLFEILDVTDATNFLEVVQKYDVEIVYNLAAMLSATAEKAPLKAWDINMTGHLNALELAREGYIKKLYWPSSIAVFGPDSPKDQTPQQCIMNPSTVYGISKLAGERWNTYYHKKYGVDVRSLRYPGLIGYNSLPGGGTTDYAVDIFYEAKKKGQFESFLGPDTTLPMMFMEDAIRATIEIMEAEAHSIQCRESYNLAAMSFSPEELAQEIKKHIPDFEISYNPDERQQIASSWTRSIDDRPARDHWGWNHQYGLKELVEVMLEKVKV